MLRAIIIEDEAASRDRLRRLLLKHADRLLVVAEAENGPEGVRAIDAYEPDLVFLDVSLPGCDGFEVMKSVRSAPAVIFTTAHDEYAVRAFRASVVDYLLKPIDEDHLATAVAKVGALKGSPQQWADVLSALRGLAQPKSRRIACRIGDSTFFVALETVQYFRADQGYTLVRTEAKEFLVDTPLVELENRLDPGEFVRIHRSTLVNMNQVASLKRSDDGRVTVVLKDGTELSSSRRYSDNLRRWP